LTSGSDGAVDRPRILSSLEIDSSSNPSTLTFAFYYRYGKQVNVDFNASIDALNAALKDSFFDPLLMHFHAYIY
jgi:hypothetical protein